MPGIVEKVTPVMKGKVQVRLRTVSLTVSVELTTSVHVS